MSQLLQNPTWFSPTVPVRRLSTRHWWTHRPSSWSILALPVSQRVVVKMALMVCSWCRSSLSQRPLHTRYWHLGSSGSAICSDWHSTGSTCPDCNWTMQFRSQQTNHMEPSATSTTVTVPVGERLQVRTSSSHMHFMSHNWLATKQHLYPQSVADISRHSVLSGGQDSTMWDIVWVSPQGRRSVSVSRHFLLQAPQCPCSVRKCFSRDHCCRERSKPGCRIVGSHTRWELTTWADFQLCLHRLLMSTGCISSHNG